MDLDMSEANDFYRELGNEEKAKAFSQMLGVELERGERNIFGSVSVFTWYRSSDGKRKIVIRQPQF